MTRSHAAVLAAIGSINLFIFSSTLHAQATPAPANDVPDTSMAQFQFSGVLNDDNVYVRSGASENDYPIMKLNKGDAVVVVGAKFDWLKVLPPEGAFCLVGKAWVDKRGDGSVGRVREDVESAVNVRIASSLNNMISKVAVQLKGGDDVKILGEQDGYFKIIPPAGTFAYVHKKFVDVVKRVEVVTNNGNLEVKHPDAKIDAKIDAPAPNNPVDVAAPIPTTPQATGPTTVPSAPVVQSASADDEAAFDALEKKFSDASNQPIEQQPIEELLAGYQKITTDKKLPESMLRIADVRLKGLTLRRDALADSIAGKKRSEALAAKSKPLEVESKEIEQRIKENQIQRFVATGTLRTSALPYAGKTLYRLTDPATERTVVYVLTDDPNVTKFQGLFVGIKGNITDDTVRRVKFIEPMEVEIVDPASIVRGSVTSNLTPASLLPTSTSAE